MVEVVALSGRNRSVVSLLGSLVLGNLTSFSCELAPSPVRFVLFCKRASVLGRLLADKALILLLFLHHVPLHHHSLSFILLLLLPIHVT